MKEDIASAFGAVVRQLRIDRGLSQQEVSFRTDIDRSFLSQLETGRQLPTLFRLAEALNIKPSTILQRVEKAINTTND
ncbi:MAG: helix-turn-helix transcriptional regulator [Ignavibacteria bacterium]|nr:helix-turn-helix transcriptional regulator [Ignavibacteria bacterium]